MPSLTPFSLRVACASFPGHLCPARVARSSPSQPFWRPQRISSGRWCLGTEKSQSPWARLAVYTLSEARPALGLWTHFLQVNSHKLHTHTSHLSIQGTAVWRFPSLPCWVQILAPPLTSCLTLEKLFSLAKPQLSHL